jgi:hypothetical protein
MQTFTITLNAEQFNAMAAKLKSIGLDGPEALEKGTLPEAHGVVLSYVTDMQIPPWPPTQVTVTFTIVKKPFIATVGMIQSAVKSMMGIA